MCMAKPDKRFHIPISFSIAIVVVAALVTWLIVVMYSARVSEEVDRPFAAIDMEKKGAPITSVIGTITSVSDASLTLTASPANNPSLSRETVVTVRVTPETQFSRSSVPQSVSAADAGNLASLYRFFSAAKADLKVGVKVNVRTGREVRGKEEVEAESIEILSIQ